MVKQIVLFFILLWSLPAFALTAISNSTSFPYSATTDNETYQLSENITCDTTCFVVSGDNVTIDLNGYTMTYGNANGVTVLNSDFENWTGNVPDNWTVISGSVSAIAAIDWGNYDLTASDSFTIRSDAFTLIGGKTYQAWAFVRGGENSPFTLKILDASDDSVITSYTMTTTERGFATDGNETSSLTMEYKPSSNINVKLQLECTGTITWIVPEVNMAPTNDYGIAIWHYQNTYYFPDLSSATFGAAPGITIKNGTITQGNGDGSYSHPIKIEGIIDASNNGNITIQNLTINYSGPNCTGIQLQSANNVIIENTTINSTSTRVFNRMYGTAGIHMKNYLDGNLTIHNVDVFGSPQYGILVYNKQDSLSGYGIIEIYDCNIRNKGVVTEPYGMAFSGTHNLKIHNNIIETENTHDVTRGFLFDAVAGGDYQGCSGDIYNNIIKDVWEDYNLEYLSSGLNATGIRIRNWGDSREDQVLNVFNNTIIAYNDSDGASGVKGIAINGQADGDNINIYNNEITVSNTKSGSYAIGISLQKIDTTNGGQYKIHNNKITSNDIGIQFGNSDGTGSIGVKVYENVVESTSGNTIDFYSYMGGAVYKDNKIYCNKIVYSGGVADEYPFKLDGDFLTGNYVSNNLVTNNNSGGYEVWADEDESSNVIFCENGTIDVTGGGSVGTASSPCQDGSSGCYSDAGISGYNTTIGGGSQSISIGSGSHTLTISQ